MNVLMLQDLSGVSVRLNDRWLWLGCTSRARNFFLRYDVYSSPRVNTVSPEQARGPLTPELKLSEVEFGRAPLYIQTMLRVASVQTILNPQKVGPWPEWMMVLMTSPALRTSVFLSSRPCLKSARPKRRHQRNLSLITFIYDEIQGNTIYHSMISVRWLAMKQEFLLVAAGN